MATPFDTPPPFETTPFAGGAAPAAPVAPPVAASAPSPLITPQFGQTPKLKTGWGDLAALLPALLGGIKDPIVAGGALAGYHQGRDAKLKQMETDQQTQERRANEQAKFYFDASNELAASPDLAHYEHLKASLGPMAKLHGVDLEAMPGYNNSKQAAADSAAVAEALQNIVDESPDGADRLQSGKFSVQLPGKPPIPGDIALRMVTTARDGDGRLIIKRKKPDLMSVAPGDVVIDKNHPTDPPVQTVPAKPAAPGSIEEQMVAAQKAGDTATYDRLKKVHEEFAAAGRKGEPDPNGPKIPGDPTKTGEAYLKTLPPSQQKLVQDIADYKMDIARVTSLRGGERELVAGMVAQYDPTFDMTAYAARQRTRNDFTSGKSAQNIKGLNTAVAHLSSLSSAFDGLNNGSYHAVNAVENAMASHLPVTQGLKDRQGALTRVRLDFNAVKNELAGAFKANGATDSEIKSWQDTVSDPVTATPVERKAFIDGAIELMGGRIGASRSQYEVGMGKPASFHMLSPEARSVLTKLGADLNTIDPGDTAAPAPAGGGTAPKVIRYDMNGKPLP